MKTLGLTDWQALHGNAYRGVRVLVTGGAGFIGSHLCEALASLGAKVVVIDDLSGGDRANLDGFGPIEFIHASILDMAAVERAVAGCRYVLHQAALGSVPRSVEQPRLYNDVNVTGTLNVLEASRAAKVQRVVFAASSSAYGDNPVPWIEHMPVRAKSPYAANKVADEALMSAYSNAYGLDTCCTRYFNIFGPRQNANSAYAAVIAAFAKALIAGQRPVIFGDGLQSRDFTFVHNSVHANLLAARCPKPIMGEVLNVGCAGQISVNQLAETMAHAMGREDLKPVYQADRAGDIKHSYADLAKISAMIGYKPVVGFEQGLKVTMDWYRTVIPAP